jgi:hypothetical protein
LSTPTEVKKRRVKTTDPLDDCPKGSVNEIRDNSVDQ